MSSMTSKEKLEALLLYICSKVPESVSGTIKINKIMWFSETESMFRTGMPLTGHTYIRQMFGPVPFNVNILRDELIRAEKLREDCYEEPDGYVRRALTTLLKDLQTEKFFTPEQIAIIDEQIVKHMKTPARTISDISHDSIWASLEDADEMPLELYQFRPHYTEEQKKSVEELAETRWREDYGSCPAHS